MINWKNDKMTAVSKKLFIDKLDGIVEKYNNIYHWTIKMKSVDVKSGTYIDFNVENNDKVSTIDTAVPIT